MHQQRYWSGSVDNLIMSDWLEKGYIKLSRSLRSFFSSLRAQLETLSQKSYKKNPRDGFPLWTKKPRLVRDVWFNATNRYFDG